MKIAELFAEVGFKFDSIKLHEVSKILGDLNLASVVGVTSLVTLGKGIQNVMETASKASISLLELKEATGLDPLRLHQLDVYFQQFGADAGEAQRAIYNLNKLRLEVLQGKGDPQPFIMTGLLPTTDTLKLLDQIHEKFSDDSFLKNWAGSFAQGAKSLQEMRAAWKDMIANQFGIPTSMLRGLDQSNEKWKEQANILGMNLDELKANAEVHETWVRAANDLNLEMQKLTSNLAPIVIQVMKIADAFITWENKTQAIQGFFERLGVIGTFIKAGAMDVNNSLQSGRNTAWNLGTAARETVKERIGAFKQQTNNVTVHVNSNTPEEFIKKFDQVWKRYIAGSDIQFGQQR